MVVPISFVTKSNTKINFLSSTTRELISTIQSLTTTTTYKLTATFNILATTREVTSTTTEVVSITSSDLSITTRPSIVPARLNLHLKSSGWTRNRFGGGANLFINCSSTCEIMYYQFMVLLSNWDRPWTNRNKSNETREQLARSAMCRKSLMILEYSTRFQNIFECEKMLDAVMQMTSVFEFCHVVAKCHAKHHHCRSFISYKRRHIKMKMKSKQEETKK
ncbi:Hypothetical predicted protein [Olea europaea subsp. europaea]|uniref:Uncharacterized protein n=1 Tax=Olea europaea subsp. europaea TaxID=158383 RepID=A0A8S0UN46_OLEEU|nr:Hypothetical predicted protein [Olea europaea subsp. europaea]